MKAEDLRDGLGFSIAEIAAGWSDKTGRFTDFVRHGRSRNKQTAIYVSSTDPWHRSSDLDPKVEQPGFDLLRDSGMIGSAKVMMSVPALYDTPENVGALAQWLSASRYPLSSFEIGEEPDGQSADADHFGKAYLNMAKAIRATFPAILIGGPSFQTIEENFSQFPKPGNQWLRQFRDFLESRSASGDFQFCTFEWYPFDDVADDPLDQLLEANSLLEQNLKRLNGQGMKDLPWMITEYGFSAFGAKAEVELPGALFNFDCAMLSLQLGAQTAYLYGYEPNELINEVGKEWGNNMLFLRSDDGIVELPTYWAAKMLTTKLCAPKGNHALIRTSGNTKQVGCYAVLRPDGKLCIALINRVANASEVHLSTSAKVKGWTSWSYSSARYHWQPAGEGGHPVKNLPPVRGILQANTLRLPPLSITVLQAN